MSCPVRFFSQKVKKTHGETLHLTTQIASPQHPKGTPGKWLRTVSRHAHPSVLIYFPAFTNIVGIFLFKSVIDKSWFYVSLISITPKRTIVSLPLGSIQSQQLPYLSYENVLSLLTERNWGWDVCDHVYHSTEACLGLSLSFLFILFGFCLGFLIHRILLILSHSLC